MCLCVFYQRLQFQQIFQTTKGSQPNPKHLLLLLYLFTGKILLLSKGNQKLKIVLSNYRVFFQKDFPVIIYSCASKCEIKKTEKNI
jgi:hypothetical protein